MSSDRLRAERPLLRRAATPAHDGTIIEIDAASAGWEYVDFAAYRLRPGQRVDRPEDDRERLVLVLEGRATVQLGRDDLGIIGSVSLHPAWPPNQPHRADIAKLLVHRRARRHGVGRALMEAIEARARAAGFSLLTLDTVRGDAAEQLYTTAGWQRVGVIPDYALYPDGRPCDTVVFYKKV